MKLTAIDPWAGTGAGFNRHAADTVYKAMAGMDPDTALVYGRLLVADSVRWDLLTHRTELTKAAEAAVAGRAEALRAHYSRSAVDKARAGQDNTRDINALVQIGKAWDFTEQERHQFAEGRTRGSGGRFMAEHHKIDTDPSLPPFDSNHAKRLGIPTPGTFDNGTPQGVPPNGRDLAHYQQAYGQIQDLLSPFHHEDLNALLHMQVLNEVKGEERQVTVPVAPGKDGITNFTSKLEPGDRIMTAGVSVTPVGSAGATFDVMNALAGPRAAGAAATLHSGVLSVGRMKQFNEERQKVGENEPYSAASRAFGRMERGSRLLQDSIGPSAPPQLQYALAVANHVGQFGPEAQKVFGPAADRAAYRYRGTERELDPALLSSFTSLHAVGREPEDVRELAVFGQEEPASEPGRGWNPGPVLQYFYKHLPNPDLNELQRRSGVIPPSEGIIIDRHGQIAAQSVGFADDWYLPFNLRHLAPLKGGEYIRTRSFGGPTTEDIYTGMVNGAQALTVVSHSGVFTVEFDKNLRGGRRFNDKAARMVARYGQLLDAVKSKQVSRGGISPTRMTDLRNEAHKFEPDETRPGFQARLNELVAGERENPTLSQADSNAVAYEWLGAQAAKMKTRDGREMSPEEFIGEKIDRQAKVDLLEHRQLAAQNNMPPFETEADLRKKIADRIGALPMAGQVRAVAEMMGGSDVARFDRAMDKAKQANRDRVTPLRLDGKGYADALSALHEQFPYYIGKPIYHPWRGAFGMEQLTDRTHEGIRDTGYVLPKHNRPVKAESGYFDRRVTGATKVRADSTRYQNFRVKQGTIEAATAPGSRVPLEGTGTGAAAQTAAAATAGGTDLQRMADMALLQEVLANQKFPAGAKMTGPAGVPIEVGGEDIRAHVALPGFPDAALKRIFGPGDPKALSPVELRDALKGIVGHTQGDTPLLKVNPARVQMFNSGGKLVPPKPIPTDVGTMLAETGVDHEFPGKVFDPFRPSTINEVELEYAKDPDIVRLVQAGQLPQVRADDWDAAIKPIKERIMLEYREERRRDESGNPVGPQQRAATAKDSIALMRAEQMRRKWVDAKANEPPPPPPPPEPPKVEERFTFLNINDQQRAQLNQLGIVDPNDPNVVEPNP